MRRRIRPLGPNAARIARGSMQKGLSLNQGVRLSVNVEGGDAAVRGSGSRSRLAGSSTTVAWLLMTVAFAECSESLTATALDCAIRSFHNCHCVVQAPHTCQVALSPLRRGSAAIDRSWPASTKLVWLVSHVGAFTSSSRPGHGGDSLLPLVLIVADDDGESILPLVLTLIIANDDGVVVGVVAVAGGKTDRGGRGRGRWRVSGEGD
jgi:hypothetical protein